MRSTIAFVQTLLFILGGSAVTDPLIAAPDGWTIGIKKVLWVQVGFSDSVESTNLESQIRLGFTEAQNYFEEVSQGQCSLVLTLFPRMIRMPKPATGYTSGEISGTIQQEVLRQLKAFEGVQAETGLYDPDNYDRLILAYHTDLAGVNNADLEGKVVRIRGFGYNSVVVHELGHSFGLHHANGWLSSVESPISDLGRWVEYGDPFDVMGNGYLEHFNAFHKVRLKYLNDTDIGTVLVSGIHRLYRHDHRFAAGQRALLIKKDGSYDYWLDYQTESRSPVSNNPGGWVEERTRYGCLVRWGSPPFFVVPRRGPLLLNMHQNHGSANPMSEAALLVGETFVDAGAGIRITPLAVGGVSPREYIDIRIDIGNAVSNRNPVVLNLSTASTSISARRDVEFTATASDPDGDDVKFRWEFGDRTLATGASVVHRWLKGGLYTVRVTAFDGKGGSASREISVSVDDPVLKWTRRAVGVTTQSLNAVAYGGGRFVAAGTGGEVILSPDGVNWSLAPPIQGRPIVRDLVYTGRHFIAAGSSGSSPFAAYSEDGQTWVSGQFPAAPGDIKALAFGNGRTVGVGRSGKIHLTLDGSSWVASQSTTTVDLESVIYSNGLFIVSGRSGTILRSSDGLVWSGQTKYSQYDTIIGSTRRGTEWLAIGAMETWISYDGSSWRRSKGTPWRSGNSAYTTSSGLTLVPGPECVIALSERESTWDSVSVDSTNSSVSLMRLAEGNNLLVVVGQGGVVYSAGTPRAIAPRFLNTAPSQNGTAGKQIRFDFQSEFPGLSTQLLIDGNKVDDSVNAKGMSWTPQRFGRYSVVLRGVAADGYTVDSLPVVVSVSLESWDYCTPQPTHVSLNAGTRVNDRWFVVGSHGYVYSVEDSGIVRHLPTGIQNDLFGIAFANGRLVLASSTQGRGTGIQGPSLWTSTDAETWTGVSVSTGISFNAVSFANGLFVAVGTSGRVATSTDGQSWTLRSPAQRQLNGIGYAAGRWIAVGDGGTIVTSIDGLAWTTSGSGTTQALRGVAYSGGVWVVVGQAEMLYSRDGTTWTKNSATNLALNGVGVVDGKFIATGDNGVVLISDDGVLWRKGDTGGRQARLLGIASSSNASVLFGSAGELLVSERQESGWRTISQSDRNSVFGIAVGKGRYVSVGRSFDSSAGKTVSPISVSGEGVNWVPISVSAGDELNLNSVSYGVDEFVAVGTLGTILKSKDGVTWMKFSTGMDNNQNAVAHGMKGWVVVGDSGFIATSPDGNVWTARNAGVRSSLVSVASGGSGFVAVGAEGAILHSRDGENWIVRNSNTSKSLRKVAWVADLGYFVGGDSGVLLGSRDGDEWTPRAIGVFDTVNAVIGTPFGIVAASGVSGVFLYSSDGISWLQGVAPIDRTIRHLCVGQSEVIAVGDAGAILAHSIAKASPSTIGLLTSIQPVPLGSTVTLSLGSEGSDQYQWSVDGAILPERRGRILQLGNIQPANIGLYTATDSQLQRVTRPILLGLSIAEKVVGAGIELAANIIHPGSGFIYDQILLQGPACSFSADVGQITRLSYIDLNDDIVQIEFSGPGTVSIRLESVSGPALPSLYLQGVAYMRGHARVLVTGATRNSNLSIFTVGRANAVNQSLFRDSAHYDGLADLAYVAIQSIDGKFGGLRTANCSYFATKGVTGIYAPNVEFTGPIIVGNISGYDLSSATIILGSGADVRVAAGNMYQPNLRKVQLSGVSRLVFTAGTTSHGIFYPSQMNAARYEEEGKDVTAKVVINGNP